MPTLGVKRRYNSSASRNVRARSAAQSAGVQAPKMVRMLRTLRRQVQGEVKKHQVANTAKPVSTLNPVQQSLVDIQAGDSYNEREGLAIRYKYISMKFNITHDNAVQTSSLRVMIVQDLRQELSAIPTAAMVLLNPANIHSSLHPQYAGRFKVHMDRIYWTNALTKTRVEDKFYKPLNVNAKWFDTSATTYQKNGFFLIVLTDAPLGNSSTLDYYCSFGFYDN